MLSFTRREFLSLGAAAIAGLRSAHVDADDILRDPRRGVGSFERERVLNASQKYLPEQPETIVSAPASHSAGGPHDYFSDYFWPDPQNPNGPYINRDGESNPGNFNTHRLLLIRLSIQVPALAAAWVLTKRRDFAAHAAAHLRAWFIEPATRLNPELQYAQAVHGVSTGRSYGIIDTLHLVEVAQSAIVLYKGGTLSESDWQGTRHWFAEYLNWMQTSEPGRREHDAKTIMLPACCCKRRHLRCSPGMTALFANAAIGSQGRSFPCRSHRMAASRLNSRAPSHMAIRYSTLTRLECLRKCWQKDQIICGITHCPMDAELPIAFTSWRRSSRTNNRGLTAMTFNTSTICQ